MRLQQRSLDDEFVLTMSEQEKDELFELVKRVDLAESARAYIEQARVGEVSGETRAEPYVSRIGELAKTVQMKLMQASYRR